MKTQILQFIQNHWMLCAGFVAVLGLLIFEEIKNKLTGIPKITAQQATLLINHENAVVVDLRGPKVFASGSILGAINVMRADLEKDTRKIDAFKDQALILADEYDNTALQVGVKLRQKGFSKVNVLAGGIAAWKDAQLPLKKNN